MQNRSREFDLLCACSAVEFTPERAARVSGKATADLDWDNFLRLAEHHGVLPLAARALRQQGVELAGGIQQALQRAEEENLRRNLWFASELARVLEQFEKRNVRAVPYKGPALAESVYGDLALRHFNDLDFLVSPSDFQNAKQALGELGYSPSALTPAVERFWLKYGYERSFDSSSGKNLIELQWTLLPYFYAVDVCLEDLLARATQAFMGGKNVPCLSAEDSLLALSVHASKHLWTRLIWICDIAESLRARPIDPAVMVKRARESGTHRMLSVSLWLAANLLGADLSPALREILASDSEVEDLGKIFLERLARGASYDLDSAEYFLLVRRLREHRADRWRYLWRLVWTPGVGDLAAVSLPEALFPLYRVVRLGRLGRKLAVGASGALFIT